MDAADNREPDIHVTIDDDVPEEHVDTIRKSVATMAKRGTATTLEAVDHNRELHALAQRMEKPLKDMVLSDDDAAAAFRARTDAEIDDASSITPSPPPEWPPVEITRAGQESDAPPQVFAAPWHFQWQWHMASRRPAPSRTGPTDASRSPRMRTRTPTGRTATVASGSSSRPTAWSLPRDGHSAAPTTGS